MNVAIYLVSAPGRGWPSPVVPGPARLGAHRARHVHRRGRSAWREGEWYRLITGGFLHGSLLHLGFNMYVLWILGKQLEPSLGRSASPPSTSPRCWPDRSASCCSTRTSSPSGPPVRCSACSATPWCPVRPGHQPDADRSRRRHPDQPGFHVPRSPASASAATSAACSVGRGRVPARRRAPQLGAPAAVGIALVAAFGLACAVASVLVA